MVEASTTSQVWSHHHVMSAQSLPLSWKAPSIRLMPYTSRETIRWKRKLRVAATSSRPAFSPPVSSGSFDRTVGVQVLQHESNGEKCKSKKRVFFLDVNPLCYQGSTPSLLSFAYWVSLFFSQVSFNRPVIAVIDGERGNEYRRRLLPSYKAHRMKFSGLSSASQGYPGVPVERSHQVVMNVLRNCNVPVLKVEGHEADDVVATLVEQVLHRGYKVVIASPDKDFKQLISDDVQLAIPLPRLDRWSLYTLKHYLSQYHCDPESDLSLRCIIGDEVDGVRGIQNMVPGFGRRTALKLIKKHGSLENLLNAAAVRTVGRQYAQDALTKYADHLRTNYQVLALRRDVDVHLQDEWLNNPEVKRFKSRIRYSGSGHVASICKDFRLDALLPGHSSATRFFIPISVSLIHLLDFSLFIGNEKLENQSQSLKRERLESSMVIDDLGGERLTMGQTTYNRQNTSEILDLSYCQ
ncbi:hypothetical protein Nepgr_002155 [Nepenthes gracilis]|uniref:5'-3' exonuclease domain-containing protein n=1 Tax=Nepenthes gracilis TaxID=150966 RepID=A0AAD3P6D7_NEPGR|nr:hypothetical protein Nepgr_002155 [Nepenthes gracilis]